MNIQFGGSFVSTRIKRQEGGMSTLETITALQIAQQEQDGFLKSGKAQRAEVVLLEKGSLPELPEETGMLVIIATDEDSDNYKQVLDKPAQAQHLFAKRLYEQALVSERAEAENPVSDPIKVSTRLIIPKGLESEATIEMLAKAMVHGPRKAKADCSEMVSSGKATIASAVYLTKEEIPELPDETLLLSVIVTGKDAKEYNHLQALQDSKEKSAFFHRIYEKALASETA